MIANFGWTITPTSIGWSLSIFMTLPSKVGRVFLLTLFTLVVEHVPPWGLLSGWKNTISLVEWSLNKTMAFYQTISCYD